jgi:hypothetical protein
MGLGFNLGGTMPNRKRELEIALLKIQTILLEADAFLCVEEEGYAQVLYIESSNDNDSAELKVPFENYE